MSTLFDVREALLERKPVYRAVFASGSPVTFASHRVRVHEVDILDSLTVDEFFSIDEFKAYPDDGFFPFVNRSPLGDMFAFSDRWTLATALAYMDPPTTNTPRQIIPEQGRCSVGAIQLTIEDGGGEATALMSRNIQGKPVDIYGGFHDFDEDDYQFLFRGSVQSVQLDGDLVRYRVQVHDPLTRVNRKLFSGAASTLNSDITASTVTFSVPIAGISFFQDSGYLLIDNEILYFGDREFTQFVFVERGMFNEQGGRPAAAHAEGATVKEIFPLGPAHPIDILLGIYYGTPSKSCLGLGYNDLDWMAFQRARDILGASYQMQFFLIAEENALEFMSREIHKVIGAYPFITADGRISIKVFEPAGTAVATFDHQSILENGGRVEMGWTFGQGVLGQVINDVSVNYNIDPTTGKNYSFYRDTRATSITNHDRLPVVFNSAGLRMELAGTDTFIAARVTAILDRYEHGRPVITLSTHLQKQSIDVGDVVSLTSHLIPNRQTGARGVTTAKAEVINRSIHWDTGRVQFTLLGLDAQL